MSIVAAGSVSDFFEDVVADAMRARKVDATPAATSYIVALLADFARPDARAEETLERPLTFLLDEALHTANVGERFDKLRSLGDGILYSSGFFADHFEARGVAQNYIIGLGAAAYENAGAIMIGPKSLTPKSTASDGNKTLDIFRELAQKFAAFVAVIGDVADATIAQGVLTAKGLVKVYERWLRTRSDKLADALSSHGFVTRGIGSGNGVVS